MIKIEIFEKKSPQTIVDTTETHDLKSFKTYWRSQGNAARFGWRVAPATRTLKVYLTRRSTGELTLTAEHPRVPQDLSHAEIIERYGLTSAHTAILRYDESGEEVYVQRGAEQR